MPTILEILELAQRHHQLGQFAVAEPLYRHVLQADPLNADALHLLGVLEYQLGHHDEAQALIRRAIEFNPTAAHFHSNLGLVLKDLGQLAEAGECCRRAVQLNPQFADALCNLGVVLKAQGRIAEAMECYRGTLRLNPQHVNAYNSLGYALQEQGQLAEAMECYRQALQINPHFADALCNLGTAFQEQGNLPDAIDCFRRVLTIDPNYGNAYNNIGSVLKEQGQVAQAIECYQQALRLNPQSVPTYVNLGVALSAQERNVEALESFRAALQLNPRHANAHNNLGAILLAQGRLAEAVPRLREALCHNPQFSDALSNLGLAHRFLGQLNEAALCFEEALSHDPQHVNAHANRALLRLLRGDFKDGWPEYEYRWGHLGLAPRHGDRPRWDGAILEGKTMLIHAEQGLGDTIQFVRYAPLVKERVGIVLFECQAPLKNLLEGVAGIDQVVARGEAIPAFDVQIPLLSLPGIFGTTLATIPVSVPYLKADAERRAYWRKELESLKGFKIGVAWQGSPTFRDDKFRSLPLAQFEALARVGGVSLVSLQVGPGTDQLPAAAFAITDLGGRFDPSSLGDLAATMMNLDLIITVDTAVAHLAGALAIPVWVALPFAPDWRWLLEREDSPWYPTLRLFRQRRHGDWADVFERLAVEVRRLAR